MDPWKRCREHAVDPADAWRALAKVKARLGVATKQPGVRVGRYVLEDFLGAGGFGRVYRALDPKLDRPVAIKAVSVQLRKGAQAREVVRREAQLLARLSHPNVVDIYDMSSGPALRLPGPDGREATEDGPEQLFIVMELIQGQTLAEWVVSASPSTSEILDAYVQAGEGLTAAHRADVLHMDFKPGNVMRASDGRVVVLDFGLATLLADLEQGQDGVGLLIPTGGSQSSTRAAGTPMYMPPEQFDGQARTVEADVYSFGCALFGALAGRPPFVSGSILGLYQEKLYGPVPAAPEGVQARVVAVLRRAMAPSPGKRWHSVDAMLVALARARRPRRWKTGGLVLAGAGAVALVVAEPWAPAAEPCDQPATELGQRWHAQRPALEQALREGGATPVATDATLVRVDDHVGRWVVDYTKTCMLEAESPIAERTRACLDRSGRALSSRLDSVLNSPAMARRFSALFEHLHAGAECSSDELVRQQAPPSDLASLETIERLQQWVDNHGYTEDDVSVLEQRVAEAEALGHSPTLADVQLHAGYICARRGYDARALAYYQASFHTATAGGADRTAMLAASSLVGLPPEMIPLSEVRRWTGISSALADRLEDTERDRAIVQLNLSQALAHVGQTAQAREAVASILDFARNAPADERAAPRILYAAGMLAYRMDDDEVAVDRLVEAAQRSNASFVDDPFTMEISLALASAYRSTGRGDEGETLLRSLLERPGLPHDLRLRIHITLVVILGEQPERRAEALALVEQQLEREARVNGDDTVLFADVATTRAQLLVKLGQLDAAEQALRRARSIYLLHEGTAAPRITNVDDELARIARARTPTPVVSPAATP